MCWKEFKDFWTFLLFYFGLENQAFHHLFCFLFTSLKVNNSEYLPLLCADLSLHLILLILSFSQVAGSNPATVWEKPQLETLRSCCLGVVFFQSILIRLQMHEMRIMLQNANACQCVFPSRKRINWRTREDMVPQLMTTNFPVEEMFSSISHEAESVLRWALTQRSNCCTVTLWWWRNVIFTWFVCTHVSENAVS